MPPPLRDPTKLGAFVNRRGQHRADISLQPISAPAPAAMLLGASNVAQRHPRYACEPAACPLHSVSRGVCEYVDDLSPLACVARGLVMDASWKINLEQRWPGVATILPGHPRRQMHALRARPSEVAHPIPWIDPADVNPRQCENTVLLELKQAGVILWRAVGGICIRQPTYNFHGHHLVEEVDFDIPTSIAGIIDAELVQWWQRSGSAWPPPDYDPIGLDHVQSVAGCEISCWLQVWLTGSNAEPVVLHPNLPLENISWEVTMPHGEAIAQLDFRQDFVGPLVDGSDDLYGVICLTIDLRRQAYQTHGMGAAIEASAAFRGTVDEHGSFLLSGYLGKLSNVYA